MAFSAPQTHLWLITVWFFTLIFVLKIATFPKHQNIDINFHWTDDTYQ